MIGSGFQRFMVQGSAPSPDRKTAGLSYKVTNDVEHRTLNVQHRVRPRRHNERQSLESNLAARLRYKVTLSGELGTQNQEPKTLNPEP